VWAHRASQHPNYENIGLIIAAEWDPECDPEEHWIPWVPHRSPSPHGTHDQHARHTEPDDPAR
ncbi:MAG: hypothetical protein HOV83_24340, partial [Catenulispora sp.]|nr:hypothetical protein [Catenulispora sp.]